MAIQASHWLSFLFLSFFSSPPCENIYIVCRCPYYEPLSLSASSSSSHSDYCCFTRANRRCIRIITNVHCFRLLLLLLAVALTVSLYSSSFFAVTFSFLLLLSLSHSSTHLFPRLFLGLSWHVTVSLWHVISSQLLAHHLTSLSPLLMQPVRNVTVTDS